MIEITREKFDSIKNDEKSVVFFHKNGCPNCEKMKPLIELFETETPDVKVYSYLCERDAETKQFDDVLSKFKFKSFPLVVCYKKGKAIYARSEVFSPHVLIIPFMDRQTLQEDFFRTDLMVGQMIQQHKREVSAIRDENMTRAIVIKTLLWQESGEEMDDWELGTPELWEDGKKPCEACQ